MKFPLGWKDKPLLLLYWYGLFPPLADNCNEPLFAPQVDGMVFDENDSAEGWVICVVPVLVQPLTSVINMV